MKSQGAGTVVIGGGVIGLSAAWQLGNLGLPDVVLLERWPAVGMESSSKGNGGVRQQWTTPINVAFSRYSVGEFERLEHERGTLGFRQAGYLLIAGSPRTESILRTSHAIQRDLGVPVEWLEPAEVVKLAPYVRAEGIAGGTYCPTDGFIDPHGLLSAYSELARSVGVEIRRGVGVIGIKARSAGPFAIETTAGRIEADNVVNAAGSDAAAIGAMVGIDIPVRPVRHNLACTEPVVGFPDLIPMTVDVDMRMAIRKEVSGGIVISYSGLNDPVTRDTSFDPDFLVEVAERVDNRFPFLAAVPVDRRKCWAGLYPETPDHSAIIGESTDVPRFVIAVGFSGHGVMHSPAAGRAVAELIAFGRSETFDLAPLALERFTEGREIVEVASW